MKKMLCLLLILLCVSAFVGCTENMDSAPLGIMADGVFYELSSEPSPGEVDESAIIGTVTFYTETIPQKDGETNIGEELIGAPYARVQEGIALLYRNEWYVCTAEPTA